MSMCGCKCNCTCTAAAIVVSAIVGVLAAFFQITGMITVTTTFLWVVFGIAVGYLGLLVLGSGLCCRGDPGICLCAALEGLLVGIVGTILFALILLAFGIVATSVLSAVLVGLTVFFFGLIIGTIACLVRTVFGCGN